MSLNDLQNELTIRKKNGWPCDDILERILEIKTKELEVLKEEKYNMIWIHQRTVIASWKMIIERVCPWSMCGNDEEPVFKKMCSKSVKIFMEVDERHRNRENIRTLCKIITCDLVQFYFNTSEELSAFLKMSKRWFIFGEIEYISTKEGEKWTICCFPDLIEKKPYV